PDKLFVMNLEGIDERIESAAEIIARYDPDKVLVVASRLYAIDATKKFCELVGCKLVQGRFQPGTLTNPKSKHFVEPDLVVVSDPRTEIQALKEAAFRGIPTIGLVDTDNSARYIDLVIPCNNKGKKSLNLVYKLLAIKVLTLRGDKEGAAKAKKVFEEIEGEEAAEEKEEAAENKAAEEKEEEMEKKAPRKKKKEE
ncbi:MAG: 30S ribosomal protein S2, partial [Candidatus Micrarchaeota archaeon]|nr:30S ribosomal protein S2 [Candidatus Micrarchaeota archaeon]